MGLAPQMIANIFRIITQINKIGVTILLVEQNAQQALHLALPARKVLMWAMTSSNVSAGTMVPRMRG